MKASKTLKNIVDKSKSGKGTITYTPKPTKAPPFGKVKK